MIKIVKVKLQIAEKTLSLTNVVLLIQNDWTHMDNIDNSAVPHYKEKR